MENPPMGTVNSDAPASAFVTEPNTAVFWSGRTGSMGGPERAAEIAKQVNGKTLEMLIAEKGVSAPKFDGSAKTVEWWSKASADFAAGASGTVRVVLGERVREDSIWATKELPSLMQNARVTRIIAIDPATLKETALFDRSAEATRDQTNINKESKGRESDRRAAQAFMNEPQESAVKQHPMLAGAYAAMSVIEKQTHASRLSEDQQSKVLGAARENIAKSIQQGHYPDIKVREKNEVAKEQAYER